MNKELLNAYQYAVTFYEDTDELNPGARVLRLLENPAALLRDMEETARDFGCDHLDSSFCETSYYLYQDAKKAVSNLIKAGQDAVSLGAVAAEIIALCRDMDPYDFEDGMISDVLPDVQNNPENILGWIESDILAQRDDMPSDIVELAERVKRKVSALFYK